jgi:hypothetical protein
MIPKNEGAEQSKSLERRKFRTEIPNIVDDLNLDPYEYRLYGHIRRVAGERGECYQTTPTLAEACGMSEGKISEAKKSLAKRRAELGGRALITIHERAGHAKKRKGHTITVVDIWPVNYATYVGRSKGKLHVVNDDAGSVHVMKDYVQDMSADRSPDEIKNKPYKEETHEERERLAHASTHSADIQDFEVSESSIVSQYAQTYDKGSEAEPKAGGDPAARPSGAAKPFPETFNVTDEMASWFDSQPNAVGINVGLETEKFCDYYRGEGTKARDWVAKWRNWMRRAIEYRNNGGKINGKDRGTNSAKSASERHAEIWANRNYDELLKQGAGQES